jgi:hypothetical protein
VNTVRRKFVVIVGIACFALFSLTSCSSSQPTKSAAIPQPTKSAAIAPSESPTPVKKFMYSDKQYADAYQNMSIKTDKVAGYKFIQDKTSPIYVSGNGFYPYINATTAGSPILRLRIQYFASDWLFIESYLLNVDGTQFTITPDKVERDNGIIGGESSIWEWYDYALSSDDVDMLKAIANSKSAIIRSNGSQYYKDQTITPQQKQAIKNILIEFDALENNIDSSPNGLALVKIQKLIDGFNAAGRISPRAQFDYMIAHNYPGMLDSKLSLACAMGQTPATTTSIDMLNDKAVLTNPPGSGALTYEYELEPNSIKNEGNTTFNTSTFGTDSKAFAQKYSQVSMPGDMYTIKVKLHVYYATSHKLRKTNSFIENFPLLNRVAYLFWGFC